MKKIAKADYFISRPEQIKLSLTNLCNFKCLMCFNPDMAQARGMMDEDMVFRLLDECADEGIPKVSLGGTGEPTLHKRFGDFVSHAKGKGLWVSTTTNLSVLQPELADRILADGIDRVRLSIYSANDAEHRMYTKTGLFEKVKVNLEHFLSEWDRNGRHAEIKFSYLPLKGVNDEDAFQEAWGDLFAKYDIPITKKVLMDWAGQVTVDGIEAFRNPKQVPCPHVRYYFLILHDGVVLPCCNLFQPEGVEEVVLGDIKKQSIMDVWRSETFRTFKQAHYAAKTPGYKVCTGCADTYVDEPFFHEKVSFKLNQYAKRAAAVFS
ncbi:MAG: radical SAM/SPASM domain-containing protein [Magnetovibrionaceae bacterium]